MNVPQKSRLQGIAINTLSAEAVSRRASLSARLRCIARWHHDRANAAGRGEPDGFGGTLSLRDCTRHIDIRNTIMEQLNG